MTVITHMDKVLKDYMPTLKEIYTLYTCKSKNIFVSMLVITVYLMWFLVGLLSGGLYNEVIDSSVATFSGIIATTATFTLGSIVIFNSIFKHHPLLILSVMALMGANIGYTLRLFTIPVVDVLYDVASVSTMLVLYCISRNKCLNKFHNVK